MATAVLPDPRFAARTIAAWWHTAILIAFFVLTAVAGAALQQQAGQHSSLVQHRPNVALLYVWLIAGEAALAYYVWRGLPRPAGSALRQLVGGRWGNPRAVLQDTLLAIAFWVLWKGIAICWGLWLGSNHAASVSPLIPRGAAESLLWVALSITAGTVEELVFRGYLQRQLTALTGSTWLALVFQAAIFAIAHGYQGLQNCLAIGLYGALVTLLALWRKSLRPGMIAHVWTDLVSGLLR